MEIASFASARIKPAPSKSSATARRAASRSDERIVIVRDPKVSGREVENEELIHFLTDAGASLARPFAFVVVSVFVELW